MKNLILIRHAKSSWDDPVLTDLERPLNKRGKIDAPRMGNLLMKKGLFPDLVISSPAKRARKTANRIAKSLDYAKNRIEIADTLYLQGTPTLIDLITALPADKDRVFLVGHNPELTELANALTGGNIDNIPTCGVVSIEFPTLEWKQIHPGQGVVTLFERPPKQHPELI